MPTPRPLPSTSLLVACIAVATWFVVRPFIDPFPPASDTLHFRRILALCTRRDAVYHSGRGACVHPRKPEGHRIYSNSTRAQCAPESQGLVCAAIYILLLILFIPFAFSDAISSAASAKDVEGIVVTEFPHYQLSVYLSSLLSLLIATMLGFLDDVFDIRWRHKIPIPIIASIPLLMVYYAERGNTHVVVPLPLRFLFGTLVNLGPLYYIYMSLLSTFATNSFNILAGINGSEVSQAVIIALSVILNDLLYLPWPLDFRIPLHLLGSRKEVEIGGVWSAGMAYGSRELVERHLFSLYFMLPLLAVCTGFMYHNWYPARAFPGDTLCYVTGMAFAVVGIQAHFSKTLLLFFIPQIFNFLLSCPQLFGLVPCPRHRVPRIDHDTNLLYPSQAPFEQKPPSKLATLILRVLSTLGLAKLTIEPSTGAIASTTNLTILNFFLVRLGPMTEKRLVQVLMAAQVGGSVLAFVVRYGLAGLVYDGNRR
ncbi:Udp-n-acetylglucosamine-dolichyl-phosphate n-acetylglucosaminephosphotransferase [Mycena chlorophos]|uniref:UDP-N-acetylglucosamine--dolichyl-phosphate N-acetylglucosaminephosphotransferase n=1 Tax=Mycena chlorophos TaxID=658473 RepID=A0A8H6S3W1_MYCCL|nr:Udp-n-acetylglucosamine-dolichyl-phosphate n-acetylglucosaminephosphotransferase [Mycena chlorophos]